MPRATRERETIIRFSPREPLAVVSTDDPAMIRRLKKLNIAAQEGTFHVPKTWVKLSPPRKLSLTEEQREHRRAILVQNIRSHIEKRDKRIAA